jgi:hypothetical protein
MANSTGIVEESELIDFEPEADSRPSLRETLEAAYDEIQPDIEAESLEAETARDESGRFAARSQKAQESTGAGATEGQLATGLEPAALPVPAPAGWATDAKELFTQLPPRLQQEVRKRETEDRRALSAAQERAAAVERTWSEVDAVLAPKKQLFALNGVSPARVISQFMAWQDTLDADPVQGLRQLASSYGLDIRQLAEQEVSQPQEPPQVRELRNQVQQMQGYFQAIQQQSEAQKTQTIQSEVVNFAQETDAAGNPVRPYVEHVIEDMIPHIQFMRAQNPEAHPRQLLQAAYDKAIWANPSTRELELRRASAVPSPNLEKARRAAKIVNGESNGVMQSERPTSLRATLEDQWDKIHNRRV